MSISTAYKNLEHASTVVVAKSIPEVFYILKWCKQNGKYVSKWMYDITNFPFCISTKGNIVGWTNEMDRALYYKTFSEFLADIEGIKNV